MSRLFGQAKPWSFLCTISWWVMLFTWSLVIWSLSTVFSSKDSVAKAEFPKKHDLDIKLPEDLGAAIENFKGEKEFWSEALGEKTVEGIIKIQEVKWSKRSETTKEARRIKTIGVL